MGRALDLESEDTGFSLDLGAPSSMTLGKVHDISEPLCPIWAGIQTPYNQKED